MKPEQDDELERLLEFLRVERGFDFTGYKRTSLERRIGKRMETVGVEEYGRYLDRLQVDPPEFEQLFNFILINVTGFFRDPQVWDYLQDEVVPRLLESRESSDPCGYGPLGAPQARKRIRW